MRTARYRRSDLASRLSEECGALLRIHAPHPQAPHLILSHYAPASCCAAQKPPAQLALHASAWAAPHTAWNAWSVCAHALPYTHIAAKVRKDGYGVFMSLP